MKGLRKRLTTAVIFVGVMIGGLFGGTIEFFLLFLTIGVLSTIEFFKLTLKDEPGSKGMRLVTMLLLTMMTPAMIAYRLFQNGNVDAVTPVIFAYVPILGLPFLIELFSNSNDPFRNIGMMFIPIFYIGVPIGLLEWIAFSSGEYQAWLIFGLLLLTWANDTGAYLTGSLIGKTKLYPRISPNKTIEGSIGGVVLCLLVGYLLGAFVGVLDQEVWLIISLVIAVFGSLGDLVESMLKRSLGVKDSGSIMPGHGGILDRFDAFLFIIPFVSLVIWIFH